MVAMGAAGEDHTGVGTARLSSKSIALSPESIFTGKAASAKALVSPPEQLVIEEGKWPHVASGEVQMGYWEKFLS